MVDAGKPHNSALCHIATTLPTGIVACRRTGTPYLLRDVDGTQITPDQAKTLWRGCTKDPGQSSLIGEDGAVMPQRRKFSPQFKAEAVQMVIETGKPIAQVARDLGIHDGTLGNWVNAWRRRHPEPDQPLSPVERARLAELEDEVRKLRMENEFLKKAAAFVARTHQ